MLKRILRFIRRQPKAVREQYALWTSALFTGIVAFVWFFGGSGSQFEIQTLTPAVPEGSVVGETQTAATADSWQDLVSSFQEEIAEVTSAIEPELSTETQVESVAIEAAPRVAPAPPPIAPSVPVEVRIATITTTGVAEQR